VLGLSCFNERYSSKKKYIKNLSLVFKKKKEEKRKKMKKRRKKERKRKKGRMTTVDHGRP